MILGIDEVGRGPWAGPLVVGAVVLGNAAIEGLTDSKKLSKKRREELDVLIRAQAAGYGLGWVSATELDEVGLSAALVLATKRAVEQVTVSYTEIIIDGTINFLKETTKGQYVTTLPKADLLIPSVSAASIIAKVARDTYMAEQDDAYPGYHFKSHVGYGTAAHRAAIEQLGVTPLHRLSFAPLAKYSAPLAASSLETASSRREPVSHASRAAAELASLKQSSLRRESYSSASRAPAGVSEDKADERLDVARAKAGDVRWGRPKNLFAKGKKFLGADRTAGPASHDLRGNSNGISDDGRGHDEAKTTKQIGDAGETAAANYLVHHGHKIIERNWKTKFCEIDIVSQKNDVMYFTEVKYRKRAEQGGGLAAITPKKLRQMKFAAEYFALKNNIDQTDMRLCAIAVSGEPPEVETYLELE